MPGLSDGDLTFFESGAIVLYLGDKYGVEKQLWPGSAGQARADAVCWTVWAMTELGNYMMQYLYHGLDTPFSYKPEDRSKACAEYNRSEFTRGLDALQARLQNREYLEFYYQGRYTIVEMVAGPFLDAAFEIREAGRHPMNENVSMTRLGFDLGIVHYASDTPYTQARTLGARGLSYRGMDSTYASAVAVARRILSQEGALLT